MKRRKAVLIALMTALAIGGCSRGKGEASVQSGQQSEAEGEDAAASGAQTLSPDEAANGSGTVSPDEAANGGETGAPDADANGTGTLSPDEAANGAETAAPDVIFEEDVTAQGMDYLEDGDYPRARVCFQKAVTDKKDLEMAYRGIGIAKLGEGDYEGAIEAFDQALAEAGADAKELEYDISYYKASALVRLERLNDALELYNNLVDYKPQGKTYIGRGAVYARMGNMDMARADFDKAISQDAKNYDLYIEIYQILDTAGRTDIGQEYLKKALEIDKDKDKNNLEKSKVYYYLEQYDKARTELERIKGDGNPEATLYLAKTYEALGDLSYAQTLYREYLEKDSTDGTIYNMIAVSEIRAGDYQNALSTIQEGIEKAAYGKQNLYRNEIVAYEYLKDFATARIKMEAYLEAYPQDEDAAREYIFLKSRSR